VRSIIAAVERITGCAVPLVHAARRPGDPPMLVADASLARKLIGFLRLDIKTSSSLCFDACGRH
jgi:UDP-glucose 4-epimerase